MPGLHSVAIAREAEQTRSPETPETIDRMAAELRARSDADLPHSFYVAQVRRQLAGRSSASTHADKQPDNQDVPGRKRAGEAHPSVFHSWAFSD